MFVEGFGGAGHILFKKNPSEMEVYNDIHNCLYLLFKLLRSNNEDLIKAIQLTPYSRRQFMEDKSDWRNEADDVEKVRKFYCSIMQSVGSTGEGGWQYTKTKSRRGMCQCVSRWLGNVDENLVNIIERLREIQIENLDIIKLISKYDSTDTLFYLDPPYIKDTRKSPEVYHYEMSNEKHIELVNALIEIKGMCILSGYEHEIYKPLEQNGWTKHFLGEYAKRSRKSNDGELKKGREFVWINYRRRLLF